MEKPATTSVITGILVGVAGFEPAASWTRTKRDTKLRHTPIDQYIIMTIPENVKRCEEYFLGIPIVLYGVKIWDTKLSMDLHNRKAVPVETGFFGCG